ncbi:helix-hairpin-helix domain-containing protein [Bradyrhizobium sp. ORS 111]|uniref:helix-hairpin-helix domain-containing protein n=1 Tax=Bradyrhizobium sp. ORS 111 TaxID=1685958 RepID=UPI0038907A65
MLEQIGRHPRSGEIIVRHLAEDPAFEGVGYATAAKLWKAFGDELYALLGNGDIARLTEVLGADRAERLALAWREKLAEGDVVVWLDEHGFEQRLAKKIIRLWGAEAAAKLRESLYVMLALADWPVVDAAGRRIGIAADDPRRLVAAIEVVLYPIVNALATWPVPVWESYALSTSGGWHAICATSNIFHIVLRVGTSRHGTALSPGAMRSCLMDR